MSIVVVVRVRPFNTREKDRNSVCCIQMPGGNPPGMSDGQGGGMGEPPEMPSGERPEMPNGNGFQGNNQSNSNQG